MKVAGPVSLVGSAAVFVAWIRRTDEQTDRRGGALLTMWAGSAVLAMVPFLWLRVADVTQLR